MKTTINNQHVQHGHQVQQQQQQKTINLYGTITKDDHRTKRSTVILLHNNEVWQTNNHGEKTIKAWW